MGIQEQAKNVIIYTLLNYIECNKEESSELAEAIISNLEENNFYIQHNWESE